MPLDMSWYTGRRSRSVRSVDWYGLPPACGCAPAAPDNARRTTVSRPATQAARTHVPTRRRHVEARSGVRCDGASAEQMRAAHVPTRQRHSAFPEVPLGPHLHNLDVTEVVVACATASKVASCARQVLAQTCLLSVLCWCVWLVHRKVRQAGRGQVTKGVSHR